MSNIYLLTKITELMQKLRCACCKKPADFLVVQLPNALCKECYSWIFIEQGDWVNPNGFEVSRTFDSREEYLESKNQEAPNQ